MADYRRSEIVSGLFVMAAVVVFAALSFRVGGIDASAVFGGSGYPCRTHLVDIKTLDVGAKVSVAGQRVGSVTALELVERTLTAEDIARLRAALGPDARIPDVGMKRQVVAVDFDLDNSDLRVDFETARVSLVQDGFLGRHFLVLNPGFWPGGSAPPRLGDRTETGPAELIATESGGIEGLIASLGPVMIRVDSILAKIDDGVLSGINVERAGAAIQSMAQILDDVGRALDDENPAGLRATIVEPLTKLLANADTTVTDLRTRLLNETLAKAERLLDEGPALAQAAKEVMAKAETLIEDNRPKVSAILTDLADLAGTLEQRVVVMQERLEGIADSVQGMLVENRPEIAETMRRLRRTMWEAEMAMRKIRSNPAYLLFGDEEADMSARPVDASGTLRRGRARPYQQRDEGDGKD